MVLHARKKASHHDNDDDDAENPENNNNNADDENGSSRIHNNNKRVLFSKETRYSLLTAGGFLITGIVMGWFLLTHQHRKVILHVMTDPWAHAGGVAMSRKKRQAGFRHHYFSGPPRFVTILMPSVVAPNQRTRRLQSILETWGPSARAIYVVHNVSEFPLASEDAVISDNESPKDPYSYPQLLLVPPSISVDDGLSRLNYVIRKIHVTYNPDFAFFVNDHTFVLTEHLCAYLEHKDPMNDMYVGHALKNNNDVFNSGAAGYILSRKTMQGLVQKWDEDDPTCLVKNGAKWLQGNPGLVTAKCLKQVLNVKAEDTRRDGKEHRFHAFPLTRMVSGAVDQWYINKHQDMASKIDTDESYETVASGVDCCAKDTISFHYVEYMESRALYKTREALFKNPAMSDHELKKFMLTEWPQDFKDIGGYSRGLPNEKKGKDWNELLQVMRKISHRYTHHLDC